MASRRMVVLGAGGHAKVVLELIRAAGSFDVVGLVDPSPTNSRVLGIPVLGGDSVLPSLRSSGVEFAAVALGANTLRERVCEQLRAIGFRLPPLIHPSALVSPSARLGEGVVVMARAAVGAESAIADYAILNTGAIIEHDDRIGRAAHIAPGVALAGNVRVGARALVGIGSSVNPSLTIGDDAVVGAGSAVTVDVPAGAVVAGTPARPLYRAAIS